MKQYCFLYTNDDGCRCDEKPRMPLHCNTIQMKAKRKRLLVLMKRWLKQRYGSVQMVFYFKKRPAVHSLSAAMILMNLEGPPNDRVS